MNCLLTLIVKFAGKEGEKVRLSFIVRLSVHLIFF
jgi:hypothetical protein